MSSPLILTFDVSKGYGDFVLMNVGKHVLEDRFRLDDNAEGHRLLKQQMRAWKKQYKADRIIYVAESSGGYEDNWLRIAEDKVVSEFVEAYRLNAKIIYHEYEAQRRKSIDDGVSALTIAEHVAKNLEKFVPKAFKEDPECKAARSLVRHLVSLENDCTGHKNALLKILYQYLPSLEACKSTGWSDYFLDMLIFYGSRKSIQMAAAKGFKRLSRLPKGKAQEIAEALKNGIDVQDTPDFIVATIQSKARQIKYLKGEIKNLEKMLCASAPVSTDQVDLLCSIKGMGRVTATILLLFIEDFNRFDDASKIASFFGVQPRIKNSGDGAYKPKMSKQGSSLVRRELYLLAFRCLDNDPYLRSLYAKERQKGKAHDSALGVLMHKLIRIIYGMLKSNTAYDPGVDQLNQQENKAPKTEEPQSVKEDPARRFQSAGLDAPLSRRQKKKRKAANSYEPQTTAGDAKTGSS